jgi:hypothetical protein
MWMRFNDWLIEGRRDLKIKEAFFLTLGVIGIALMCFLGSIDWIEWIW